MKIHVEEAQVKTAAVEIKTLTVSGKQVTLAVFRQLQIVELVTARGELTGIPWGVVNYHPPKECGSSSHLHVVCQVGTELRRAYVREPNRSDTASVDTSDTVAERWYPAAVFMGWRPHDHGYAMSESGHHLFHVTFRPDLPDARFFCSGPAHTYLNASNPYVKGDPLRPAPQAREALHADLLRYGPKVDMDVLKQEVIDLLTDELACRRKEKDQWKALQALPQLFIAV